MSESNKDTLSYKLGTFLSNIILICGSACIAAVMIALTVKFVMWLF